MESGFWQLLKQYLRKMKENKATESMTPTLPHDIVVEMLSRLPVKSLLRFRSVCKQWRSLIMDPYFASTHLNQSSQRPAAIFGSVSPLWTLSFHTIDHEASISTSAEGIDSLPWLKISRFNDFLILGSCNGLILIRDYCWDLYIWNPSTRFCKRIRSQFFAIRNSCLYGLGYNSILGDYKAVVAFDTPYLRKSYAIVFSFKSNSWKQIKTVPFCPRYSQLGTLVNGVPHWKVGFYSDDPYCGIYSNHIFSFDLVEDEFKEIPQPDWLRKEFSGHLLNINEWLCSIGSFRSPEMASLDVWAMKEYGIKGSWSKIFVIPILAEIRDRLFLGHWGPWYFTKSGDIVMKVDWGEKLIIYNPKQRTYEVTFISDSVQLVPYVESLIPPVCFDSM